MPNLNSEADQGYLTAEMGVFEWPKSAADGAAGTATAETAIGLLGPGPLAIDLGSILIHPSAALTADSTNFATITVAKRTAGGAPVTIASCTTKLVGAGGTGNWTAWLAVSVPLVAGAFISPNDSITVTITKSGTGVVVPQLYLAGFAAVR